MYKSKIQQVLRYNLNDVNRKMAEAVLYKKLNFLE